MIRAAGLALLASALLLGAGCDPCPSCGGAQGTTPSVAVTREFAATGSLSTERVLHTASLLSDGTVLIAGGKSLPEILKLAEIFDVTTNTFTLGGVMNDARKDHTATLLNDGTVLVTGGDNGFGVLNSVEIFDSKTGAFKTRGSMFSPRTFHTATLLTSGKGGGRVLVTGGSPSMSAPPSGTAISGVPLGALDTAEFFDLSTGQFIGNPGAMTVARTEHSATLIQAGKNILLTGGVDNEGVVLDSAELFNTTTGAFTATKGFMAVPRHGHTATLLDPGPAAGSLAGKVLIAGGLDNSGNLIKSAELFDPVTNTFSLTGSMNVARAFHTATLLSSGQVLITGGGVRSEVSDPSAELFDPSTGTFSCVGGSSSSGCNPSMLTPLNFHTATAITVTQGGQIIQLVLLAGGTRCCAQFPEFIGTDTPASPSAEVFGGASFVKAADMLRPRSFHTATALANGQILIAGGVDTSFQTFNTGEVYDPKKGTFSPASGNMVQARSAHMAATLACANPTGCRVPAALVGEVLLAGGHVAASNSTLQPTQELAGAELFNPTGGTFSATGSMVTARDGATATLLGDGRVLIAGGEDLNSNPLQSAEIYDPLSGAFACVGGASGNPPACNPSMTAPRVNHAAALIAGPGGNPLVLITGGSSQSNPLVVETRAELFDPATNTFSATSSMTESRFFHTATLLGDGRTLIAGGAGDLSAETFDPVTAKFTCLGGLLSVTPPPLCNSSMTQTRFAHTATLLDPSLVAGPRAGQVLISGGFVSNAFGQLISQATAEFFDPTGNGGQGAFAPAGNMTSARAFYTATLLGTGQVLLVGGEGVNTALDSAELFTPPPR